MQGTKYFHEKLQSNWEKRAVVTSRHCDFRGVTSTKHRSRATRETQKRPGLLKLPVALFPQVEVSTRRDVCTCERDCARSATCSVHVVTVQRSVNPALQRVRLHDDRETARTLDGNVSG